MAFGHDSGWGDTPTITKCGAALLQRHRLVVGTRSSTPGPTARKNTAQPHAHRRVVPRWSGKHHRHGGNIHVVTFMRSLTQVRERVEATRDPHERVKVVAGIVASSSKRITMCGIPRSRLDPGGVGGQSGVGASVEPGGPRVCAGLNQLEEGQGAGRGTVPGTSVGALGHAQGLDVVALGAWVIADVPGRVSGQAAELSGDGVQVAADGVAEGTRTAEERHARAGMR
jgi:hypothetical protein